MICSSSRSIPADAAASAILAAGPTSNGTISPCCAASTAPHRASLHRDAPLLLELALGPHTAPVVVRIFLFRLLASFVNSPGESDCERCDAEGVADSGIITAGAERRVY